MIMPLVILAYGIEMHRGGEKSKSEEMIRSTATVLSLAPGAAHAYLGKKKAGIAIFVAFIASLIAMYCGETVTEYFECRQNVADMAFVYGGISLFTLWIWSPVRVTEICNEMGLPYRRADLKLEIDLERTGPVIAALLLSAFALAMASSIAMLYAGFPYPELSAIAMALSLWLPASLALRRKRREVDRKGGRAR
ncbi:MAG: hypothetical protein LBG62_02360 [Candidatus Methanoplasma sp.]|nr:hypothetical protein [Candidatus Methanoplasma sp.]